MKATILLVDDVKINLDILRELLRDRYNIICATDGKEAIEVVNKQKIDLILLDIMMPNLDGYEVCAILKKNPKTTHIPVIFITSKVDEASIARGYEMGAVDYITKPYKKLELLAKIKTHLNIKHLIEELEYIATHDTMTNVYNRRQFFKLAIQKFNQNSTNLYAIMIDIDKFKNINDTYGHHIGDVVIKRFAKIVKNNISADAIFGRLGGEEFGLVEEFENIDKAKEYVEAIRKEIEKSSVLVGDKLVRFTISLGFAQKNKQHKSIDELLKDADIALYEAKGSGRNRTIFRKRG
jgi:diguanylate cyclase (GGDEF)-like protein